MTVMTGSGYDIWRGVGTWLGWVSVGVFSDELWRVLEVGSGVTCLIAFATISFPLISVIKLVVKYFGGQDLINFVFSFIGDDSGRRRRIATVGNWSRRGCGFDE